MQRDCRKFALEYTRRHAKTVQLLFLRHLGHLWINSNNADIVVAKNIIHARALDRKYFTLVCCSAAHVNCVLN